MYIPPAFAAEEQAAFRIVRDYPLSTLMRNSPDGLSADHIPLLLIDGKAPTLEGHVARANPLRREVGDGLEVLAVFQGPSAYISPSWYSSKQQDPRVVPTWNYAVVHVHGRVRIIDDVEWLTGHLTRLTASQEADRRSPWQITDAPAEHIERLQKNIVGIEIEISRVVGKIKASQNQPEANRASVVRELRNTPQGQAMADLVESYS